MQKDMCLVWALNLAVEWDWSYQFMLNEIFSNSEYGKARYIRKFGIKKENFGQLPGLH